MINSLFDIRKDELAVLSINDGKLTTIEGEENIWNYEFLNHYKRNEKGEYQYFCEGCSNLMNQKILTLSYRSNIKDDSDKDKSISKKDAKDIRSLKIIDENLEVLSNNGGDEDKQIDYDFFMFLLRRKAYCMIELKEYNEEEKILKHILKHDPENKFAKQEIEYINRINHLNRLKKNQ